MHRHLGARLARSWVVGGGLGMSTVVLSLHGIRRSFLSHCRRVGLSYVVTLASPQIRTLLDRRGVSLSSVLYGGIPRRISINIIGNGIALDSTDRATTKRMLIIGNGLVVAPSTTRILRGCTYVLIGNVVCYPRYLSTIMSTHYVLGKGLTICPSSTILLPKDSVGLSGAFLL